MYEHSHGIRKLGVLSAIISNDSTTPSITQVPTCSLDAIHAQQRASPIFLFYGVNKSRFLCTLYSEEHFKRLPAVLKFWNLQAYLCPNL